MRFADKSPRSAPDFTKFSWDDRPSNITVDIPKSDTASSRSAKVCKTSRRRIVRACTRCRLHKIKCDGGKPCIRCTDADDVCEYMKCSKKASKEYSQDYVDRLLEQNDKYKTAMRILYANRRLSVHSDNIVIPNAESDDVPLVHDILDRLGMVDTDEDSHSQSSHQENYSEKQKEPALARIDTFTAASMSSPSETNFCPTIFDGSFAMDAQMDTAFFPELDPCILGNDIGLTFPFKIYSSMGTRKNVADSTLFPPDFTNQDLNMNLRDWCPLSMLDLVTNGGDISLDPSWAGFKSPY